MHYMANPTQNTAHTGQNSHPMLHSPGLTNTISRPKYELPFYPLYQQQIEATPCVYLSDTQVEDFPCKYLGYRAFSKWAASSEDALIIRRFNTLNARVLLFMQDEIVRIESDLEELDKQNIRSSDLVHNGTFSEEHVQARNNLLGLLVHKLKAYSTFHYALTAATSAIQDQKFMRM